MPLMMLQKRATALPTVASEAMKEAVLHQLTLTTKNTPELTALSTALAVHRFGALPTMVSV